MKKMLSVAVFALMIGAVCMAQTNNTPFVATGLVAVQDDLSKPLDPKLVTTLVSNQLYRIAHNPKVAAPNNITVGRYNMMVEKLTKAIPAAAAGDKQAAAYIAQMRHNTTKLYQLSGELLQSGSLGVTNAYLRSSGVAASYALLNRKLGSQEEALPILLASLDKLGDEKTPDSERALVRILERIRWGLLSKQQQWNLCSKITRFWGGSDATAMTLGSVNYRIETLRADGAISTNEYTGKFADILK